jgi:beta-glucosidase
MAKHSDADIKKLIQKMTLKEKCSLLSGADFWHTKTVDRLGIPNIMVSDGPHGLRKQDVESPTASINDSIKAVCFPAACASTCSFDRSILKLLGETLGDECQAQNVSVVLGPAVNIKRSPLCGRNFEYMSEDPYLAGELAASDIQGVQSKHVGTSIKHFALNNQEYRRLTNSSNCDMRTIREIYLPAFEAAIKQAQPATIMHSYNQINGTYAGESKWLLTDILRNEWGFKGVVVSDWGAVNNRCAGLAAGCDLEMPSSNGLTDAEVEAAVKAKKLDKKLVDESCFRILRLVFNFLDNRDKGCFDFKKHHEIARKIEEESIVLLKNNGVLPLHPVQKKGFEALLDGKKSKIAVIGEFAQKPRFQGGGSSHINTTNVTSALESFRAAGVAVQYSKGYEAEPNKDESIAKITAERLLKEAVATASKCGTAIIFAGLPDNYESEGYDRRQLSIPAFQNLLIEKVAAVNKNVIVVLHNGSPVTMPWLSKVSAVVEAYLGGEAVGEAVVNVLLGKVNPSGKLAETFPIRLEDTPSYPNFAANKTNTNYTEGIFVGYRYYDMKAMPVLFPFGYGLSYTTFAYSDLTVSKKTVGDDDTVTVKVKVTNTGMYDGKETVQLYIADGTGSAIRPPKELKGFTKLFIKAGDSAVAEFTLTKRSFAYFNTDLNDWYAASGDYDIMIGSSSRDIQLIDTIHFNTKVTIPFVVDENTTVGDLIADKRTAPIVSALMKQFMAPLSEGSESSKEAITDEMIAQMMDSQPLRCTKVYMKLTNAQFNKLLKTLQAAVKTK